MVYLRQQFQSNSFMESIAQMCQMCGLCIRNEKKKIVRGWIEFSSS